MPTYHHHHFAQMLQSISLKIHKQLNQQLHSNSMFTYMLVKMVAEILCSKNLEKLKRTENPRVGGSNPPLGTTFSLNIKVDRLTRSPVV